MNVKRSDRGRPNQAVIVCAAVSAVSIGAVNGVEALAGFKPDVIADEVHGGHLQMKLKSVITGEQSNSYIALFFLYK